MRLNYTKHIQGRSTAGKRSARLPRKAITFLTIPVVLMFALFAVPSILAAGKGGPDVSIVSPADGVATDQGLIDVEVAFRASANPTGKAKRTTGNVSTVILPVNGVEVDRYENPRNVKEGTHTFEVDLSAFPDGAVTLQACAYQGNVKAGNSTQIPHLTLSGRHSGRAACVQVSASGHVGQSEVIGRPLVVACWVLAAITCRCGLLSG